MVEAIDTRACRTAFAAALRAELVSGRLPLKGVQPGESRSALGLALALVRQLEDDMAADSTVTAGSPMNGHGVAVPSGVADGLYEPPADQPAATAAVARFIAITGHANPGIPASFVMNLYAAWGIEALQGSWSEPPAWRTPHRSPGSGADLTGLPADAPHAVAQRVISLMGGALTYAAALAAPEAAAQHAAGRRDGYRAAYETLQELRAPLAGGEHLPDERLRAQEREACEWLAQVLDSAPDGDGVTRDVAAHLRHTPRMPGEPSRLRATLTVAGLPALARLTRLCAGVASARPVDPLALFMASTVGLHATMAGEILRTGAESELPESILATPSLDAGALVIARVLGGLEGDALVAAAFVLDTAHAFARDLLAAYAHEATDDTERACLEAASRACHARACSLAAGVIGLAGARSAS